MLVWNDVFNVHGVLHILLLFVVIGFDKVTQKQELIDSEYRAEKYGRAEDCAPYYSTLEDLVSFP